jgi:hypothetical protein
LSPILSPLRTLAATSATALVGTANTKDWKDDHLKTIIDNGLRFGALRWQLLMALNRQPGGGTIEQLTAARLT